MTNRGEKERHYYSFATKYCSFHSPAIYPIYDNIVDGVLWHLSNRDDFIKFKRQDLKDYEKFIEVLEAFKDYYGLQSFNFKDLDRYMWQLGKDNL